MDQSSFTKKLSRFRASCVCVCVCEPHHVLRRRRTFYTQGGASDTQMENDGVHVLSKLVFDL